MNLGSQSSAIEKLSEYQNGSSKRVDGGGEIFDDHPLPLMRVPPDPMPYPVEAMGEILSQAAIQIHNAVGSPLAMCCQSILAAATLAAQPLRSIRIGSLKRPISDYFVTVGASGERKSATDEHALRAHRKWEQEKYRKYEEDLKNFERALDLFNAEKAEIIKNHKRNNNSSAHANKLKEMGDPPTKPLRPLLTIEEPTYEGLIVHWKDGCPNLGLFSDEGGRLIGGFGMNEDNQIKTAAGFSELWDGKRITRVRASETSVMHGKRFSMHLMVQPRIATEMFSNLALMDQGLYSRILAAFPISTVGSRFFNEVDLQSNQQMVAYYQRITEMLNISAQSADSDPRELDPPVIEMIADAKEEWIKFHDELESRQVHGKDLFHIRGFSSKAAEHCARIAATISLVENPSSCEISKLQIHGAISLLRFYISEALRLFYTSKIEPELHDADELLAWLVSQGREEYTLKMIYQFGPNRLRSAKSARRTMAVLEEHRYVARKECKQEIWLLRPSLNVTQPC